MGEFEGFHDDFAEVVAGGFGVGFGETLAELVGFEFHFGGFDAEDVFGDVTGEVAVEETLLDLVQFGYPLSSQCWDRCW